MLIDKAGAAVWGAMSLDERAGHIETFKAKLLDRKDEVVSLLVKVGIALITLSAPPPPPQCKLQETGKVTDNAAYDFTMLTDCLSFHIEEARRNCGAVIPSPTGAQLSYTQCTPVGVVVAVL
jgi:acyl-CoA reductase-like NAD-dependent aldehyde dehydrogenase